MDDLPLAALALEHVRRGHPALELPFPHHLHAGGERRADTTARGGQYSGHYSRFNSPSDRLRPNRGHSPCEDAHVVVGHHAHVLELDRVAAVPLAAEYKLPAGDHVLRGRNARGAGVDALDVIAAAPELGGSYARRAWVDGVDAAVSEPPRRRPRSARPANEAPLAPASSPRGRPWKTPGRTSC